MVDPETRTPCSLIVSRYAISVTWLSTYNNLSPKQKVQVNRVSLDQCFGSNN